MITADHIEAWFGLNELTKREWADAKVAIGLVAHMVITAGFFCLTTLFYKPLEEQRQKDVDKFFNNLATPLVSDSTEQKKLDNKQRKMLGSLIAVSGIGVIAMFALPNPLWGRMTFVLCGAIVLGVGLLLVKAVDDSVEEKVVKTATNN
ncbi:sodium-solute symporter putative [Vibrio maritimus]|uniref:Sodium-solute symporter putative n=2 Tax=Vibrio TaxID=662 RepID=A0A090RYN0_9VIBR|nr:sodium-solute symporter putative [Vibrio maritimus]